MKTFKLPMTLAVIALLQGAMPSSRVMAQSSTGAYTVTVTTPGTFGQAMLQTVENWTDVEQLTVKGSLNEADMAYFSRLQNMSKLDLSQTDIQSISGCNGLTLLETVALPESVTSVANEAFQGCSSLSGINLGNATEIGEYAFYDCINLASINLENAKTINGHAFSGCSTLADVKIPKVEEIDSNGFSSCSALYSIDLSNVRSIGGKAFHHCSSLTSVDISKCTQLGKSAKWYEQGECFAACSKLKSIKLSNDLENIPNRCFYGCAIEYVELPESLKTIEDWTFYSNPLKEIAIPEGVTTIDDWAFADCPLETITLPSTISRIDTDAFNYFKEEYINDQNVTSYVLKDVYCKSVVPFSTETFNNDMAKGATLHVPAFSVSAYKLDDKWYKFNRIVAIDGELSDITINNNFTIVDYTGLADKANITLATSTSGTGHLTISGESPLSLGTFAQNQSFRYEVDYDEDYNRIYNYPYFTTLIPDSEVRADNVTTKVQLILNQWAFISFPYDVNISDIKVPEGIMWVVRRYNGANRAAMSGDTWENVTNGQTLNAGEGYILHCVAEDSESWDSEYVEFEFPALNNSNKNNVFAHSDVTRTLNAHPAEFSHNRGWNLIGNPYPSFYNCHSIDFNAPVTVWNGSGYTAYSLADDEYILRPNEAFFVQCPINNNQIKFAKEGRTHDCGIISEDYRSPSRVTANPHRQILNFEISDGQHKDRARLVINDEAAEEYEIECDASKFMSSNPDVPQIYIVDNGINYAIDERPLGEGRFNLGVRIGRQGTHTLSLNTKNLNLDVILIDKETGSEVNLANEAFSFDSPAQTYADRFMVVTEANASGIDTATKNANSFAINGNMMTFDGSHRVSISSVDGRTVFSGVSAGVVALQPGIYVVNIDNEVYKVAVK